MLKIKIKEDFRKLKSGTEINFKDHYNVLIGDNMSGKSTLLQLIWSLLPHHDSEWEDRYEYNDIKKDLGKVDIIHDYDYVFFYDNINATRPTSDTIHRCGSKAWFVVGLSQSSNSHGQLSKKAYRMLTDEMIELREKDNFKGKSLLLIDEGEVGMSLMVQTKLPSSLITVAIDGKFDLLVATHNPFIIADERFSIYNMDSQDFIDGKKFISSFMRDKNS